MEETPLRTGSGRGGLGDSAQLKWKDVARTGCAAGAADLQMVWAARQDGDVQPFAFPDRSGACACPLAVTLFWFIKQKVLPLWSSLLPAVISIIKR